MEKKLRDLFGNHTGLDNKSVAFLTKALAKNNLPGFDYLEFKQSIGALSAMNMDEDTAIKSAFVTAGTMGLTKAKLLSSIEHYKKVLSSEKGQFDLALQNQMTKKVEGKRAEVEKLKGHIGKWEEQMAKLQAQITKSQDTIDHADEVIAAETEKIQTTKSNFEHTFQSVVNQIDKDAENINMSL
jgi:predicted  nucleic acid-binding Zn-ribbon protein